jgi:S-adenosylmethionine:tRNA ribosyltransferase-isomerase
LESAADPDAPGHLKVAENETRLLIQPGYRWRVVDGMLTNFHLPSSTLLALVAAFAGRERTLDAYGLAVREAYRFFSYGDAMLLWRDA